MTYVWDDFTIYFEDALAKNDRCDFAGAVESWNCALAIRDSIHARWNRGQALLSLGRYPEGFRDHEVRNKLFPKMLNDGCVATRARLPLWRGEDIRGKRLVILSEAGYGDVVMLSRFVPMLQALGIEVVLCIPPPLHRLLAQLAPIGNDGDVCCQLFDLMVHLGLTTESIRGAPYLQVDPAVRRRWHWWLPEPPFGNTLSIGIAWMWRQDCGHERDFERAIPIDEFVSLLDAPPDVALYSLQPNDDELAAKLGVVSPPYEDFCDVAAIASLMDMIICADVAAIHVAGSIGHRNSFVMLPWLSSWRWLGENVWYPHVGRCQQDAPRDWKSAFAKLPRPWKSDAALANSAAFVA